MQYCVQSSISDYQSSHAKKWMIEREIVWIFFASDLSGLASDLSGIASDLSGLASDLSSTNIY